MLSRALITPFFGIIKRNDTVTENIMDKKVIALVAHDHKKADMIAWATENKEKLSSFDLCGTGTTAGLVAEKTGLTVKKFLSGPMGGDLEIGACVAEGTIDAIVFLWDPLEAQPHDPDVKALLRIAVVYDIPIATNVATANCIIHSGLL